MNELKIDIQVVGAITDGSYIEIVLKDLKTSQNITIREQFTSMRISPGQISIGDNLGETLKNTAVAITKDFGGIFKAEYGSNRVSLTSTSENFKFLEGSARNPILGIDFANFEVNSQVIDVFKILNVITLTHAPNPCGQVVLRVTTNKNLTSICNDVICIMPNGMGGDIICNRGVTIPIICSTATNQVSRTITTPPLLDSISNPIRLEVLNTPNGASVSVHVPNAELLGVEYSLDNVNWFSESSFSGLENGNYTVYIRDQYGCKKTKYFAVVENNFEHGEAFISKENSIRFKEQRINYLTDENSKYCESNSKLNYGYVQEFLSSDSITTQFKSNYLNVSARLINQETDEVTPIICTPITQNLNNKAKYTGVKAYQFNENQFGVYFESGNILDYDTNVIIDSYSLNGGLPLWAKLGNSVNLNGVGYYIDNIGFDETVNAEVLIFNGALSLSSLVRTHTLSCVFNLQDYEVYEFTIDFSRFLNQNIILEIINDDPNFGNHIIQSETLHISPFLKDYLEINYWNTTNTNIIYSSGIRHLLRLPYNRIKAADTDTHENGRTDTSTRLLKAEILEATEFEFMPFPLELYRKVKIALSLDNVFINEVGYIKGSEFQKENLGSSNLYKLTATMIKSGNEFNSSLSTEQDVINIYNENIPGLINSGNDSYLIQ